MKVVARSFANWAPVMCFGQGDGKPFWKHVVSEATGCDNVDYFEEIYEVYCVASWDMTDLNNLFVQCFSILFLMVYERMVRN